MPLYNKAPFVTKALESVLAQTYTDYECVIVNDGSTDDSLLQIENWKLRIGSPSKKFRVISQTNAGVSAARNRGIQESKNEYLAFLDADDWWEPTYLEEMVKLAEKYPEAGLWACNYIYYKPGKTHVGVSQVHDARCTMHNESGWSGYINYPKSYYEGTAMPITSNTVLVKRSVLDEIARWQNGEIFPVGIKLGEDFLLWCKIAMNYKVAFLNKPLAYYNNDVPVALRATRNLHKPESNMLWHLDWMHDAQCTMHNEDDWKRLLDKLRVQGLMEYWMSDQYHDLAAAELKKVSCPLPKAYSQPIRWLRMKKRVMTFGSFCKTIIRKMNYAK